MIIRNCGRREPGSRYPAFCPRTALLLVALLVFVHFNVAGETLQWTDERFRTSVQSALRPFKAVTNVEVIAVDEMWLSDPEEVGVTNFFRRARLRFVMSGARYRIECTNEFDRQSYREHQGRLMPGFIQSYDGTKFYSYNPGSRIMAMAHSDEAGDTSACPLNPAVAHFLFLSRESDDCPTCRVHWKDLVGEEPMRQLRYLQSWGSNGVVFVCYAGPLLQGVTQLWTVTLRASADGFKPESIMRELPGLGKLWYRFHSYAEFFPPGFTGSPGLILPTDFSYAVAKLDSQAHLQTIITGRTVLVSLQFPKEVPHTEFELDTNAALVIRDKTTSDLVKTAHPYAIALEQYRQKRIIILGIMGMLSLAALAYILCSLSKVRSNLFTKNRIGGVVFIVVLIFGAIAICLAPKNRQQKATQASAATTLDQQKEGALEKALEAWQRNERSHAVAEFVRVDWSRRPLFPARSLLGLSEKQYHDKATALTAKKEFDQFQELVERIGKEVQQLRALISEVYDEAQRCAKRGDIEGAERYLNALRGCGEALSDTNHMVLLQRIGEWLVKKATNELSGLRKSNERTP